jgi:hypothetical protein
MDATSVEAINAEAREVGVLAIGVKDRNRLYLGGEEFEG